MTDQEKELEQRSMMRRVDLFTEPARMSQAEALEFMENLKDDLEVRIETLKGEMGEDPEDEDDGA